MLRFPFIVSIVTLKERRGTFLKKKHTTLGASVVAWRLRTALNYSSVHRFATELEKVATAYPISLRSIDATVFADGFLKALKDGDGNTASRIAWTLKHRTPEGASDAQERIFVRHVFDNVLKEPLYWGEEEALLGLVASKYPVPPDTLLAVGRHFVKLSQGKVGNLLVQVGQTLKREKYERMERSGRSVSDRHKDSVSRSA